MKPRCDFFGYQAIVSMAGERDRLFDGVPSYFWSVFWYKNQLSANLKHFQYQQEIFIRLRPTATNTASDRAGLLHREHSERVL